MSHAVEHSTRGGENQKLAGGEETEHESKESDNSNPNSKNTSTEETLPTSEIFELLSADRRQEVLRYLDSTDGTADIGELAEHIASIECGCPRSQLSSQQRKRVYVGLYQCHLPKMADAEVIDYNSDRGTVALTERSQRLLRYLYFEEEDTSSVRGLITRVLQ